MQRPPRLQHVVGALALLLSVAADAAGAASAANADLALPTPDAAAVRAGKRLYQSGQNRLGGELQAQVGGGVALGGELVACARCHGAVGQGQREGGAAAPPLRWAELTRARPAGAGLLARPAYDEGTLLRALRDGLGADGRPLGAAMPRFSLAPREAADLLAYLRAVGTDLDPEPGVSPGQLRLITALPLSGPLAPAGRAARAGLEACLARANQSAAVDSNANANANGGADPADGAGGVYGRRLQLTVLDSQADPQAQRAAAAADDHLLWLAPWWPALSAATLAQRLGPLPVLGPLGAAAEIDGLPPHWFGVAPQLADQARVMVDAVAEALPPAGGRLLLLAGGDAVADGAAAAARRQAVQHTGLVLEVLPWPADPSALVPALDRALAERPPQAVLALVPSAALEAVADAVARRRPTVPVYASLAQSGSAPLAWPVATQRVLHLATASPQADELAPQAYRADLALVQAAPSLPAVQTVAYTAACAAVEGLRRAGRTVGREALLRGLEGLRDFRSGVAMPLSYGPRQRHGVWDSQLTRVVDGRLQPLGPRRSPRIPN